MQYVLHEDKCLLCHVDILSPQPRPLPGMCKCSLILVEQMNYRIRFLGLTKMATNWMA